MESDPRKLLDKEHRTWIAQGVGAGESSLTNRHLLLIHARIGSVEIGVGVADLGNLAHKTNARGVAVKSRLAGVFVDLHPGLGTIVQGGLHGYPCSGDSVAGMGCDDRAVGRSQTPDHQAGALIP